MGNAARAATALARGGKARATRPTGIGATTRTRGGKASGASAATAGGAAMTARTRKTGGGGAKTGGATGGGGEAVETGQPTSGTGRATTAAAGAAGDGPTTGLMAMRAALRRMRRAADLEMIGSVTLPLHVAKSDLTSDALLRKRNTWSKVIRSGPGSVYQGEWGGSEVVGVPTNGAQSQTAAEAAGWSQKGLEQGEATAGVTRPGACSSCIAGKRARRCVGGCPVSAAGVPASTRPNGGGGAGRRGRNITGAARSGLVATAPGGESGRSSADAESIVDDATTEMGTESSAITIEGGESEVGQTYWGAWVVVRQCRRLPMLSCGIPSCGHVAGTQDTPRPNHQRAPRSRSQAWGSSFQHGVTPAPSHLSRGT